MARCGGFVKPTLLPIALAGMRKRSFWAGAAVLVGIDLALAGLSREYLSVVLNARGPLAMPIYSAGDLGIIGIALVAWLGDPGYRGAAGGEEPETKRGRWRMRRRLGGLPSPERRVLPTDGTFGGSAKSTARGHN